MILKFSKIQKAILAMWFVAFAICAQAHPEHFPPAGNLDRLTQAGPVIAEVVERFGFWFEPADQQTLSSSAQELIGAGWYRQTNSAPFEDLSISVCQLAIGRIERVLQGGQLERINPSSTRAPQTIKRRWPSGKGMLLFRIEGLGGETDKTPAFVRASVDLDSAGRSKPQVRIPAARTVYAIIYGANAIHKATPQTIEFLCNDQRVASVELSVEVPAVGQLEVIVKDQGTGHPTPIVVGLYAEDHQLVVPPDAISLDFWQNGGEPVKSRPYRTSRYWPGATWEREVCFANGRFAVTLPEGEYQLIVGKGPEYEPERRTCHIKAGKTLKREIGLRRWVDMQARGWVSGDVHVHFSRKDPKANGPLMIWTRAEDVHVANVLLMGDANRTYFEQYAYGPQGRAVEDAYSLISGQEDPRSEELGHVLAINLRAPVRWPSEYHLYDSFFDGVHAQGGLAGYAHVYQPPRPAFWVRRDMTLNIPKGKVDFLEVGGFGETDDQLYYEFLNLGFQLTATAGSDVPWGESVGISRTYAYTGGSTDPDEWFLAVQRGHTFVTAGPMLQLRVNGQIPGAVISAEAGSTLRIEAIADGAIAKPGFLEIVAQAEVIGSAKPVAPDLRQYRIEMDVPVTHSTWITARCAGALTSPIYVRVGAEPWWKRDVIRELIDVRLSQLREIESFIARVESGYTAGYADPERIQKQMPGLRSRVAVARNLYRQLLEQSEQSGK